MSGVPNLRDIKPDDLRWSCYNNNRNKVPNKCTALESSQNHPPQVHGKINFQETCPWCQKCWSPLLTSSNPPTSFTSKVVLILAQGIFLPVSQHTHRQAPSLTYSLAHYSTNVYSLGIMSQTFTEALEDSVMIKTNPILLITELTVSHWG